MYKEIEIGGTLTPMTANATTPIRYKQVFHDDFYQVFSAELAGDDYVELAGKLAYIMKKAADGADMNKLTIDEYWTWLESLPPLAIANAAADIINLYSGSEETTAKAKKNRGRQNAPTP